MGQTEDSELECRIKRIERECGITERDLRDRLNAAVDCRPFSVIGTEAHISRGHAYVDAVLALNTATVSSRHLEELADRFGKYELVPADVENRTEENHDVLAVEVQVNE